MPVNPNTITEIIESFALTTGVPAFLMDSRGNISLESKGFSSQEYSFADLEELRHYFECNKIIGDQYYSLFTENQFLYIFISMEMNGENQNVIAGPMRFHFPTDLQLVTLLKRNKITLKKKGDVAGQIARLPEVSMVRLDHLGRVLWSLCHAYTTKGTGVLSETEFPEHVQTGHSVIIPKITFALVEEGEHVSFKLLTLARDLILAGDVAGIRALRDQYMDLPLDRLIKKDDIRSIKDNLISACGAFGGLLIFEHNVPYEQVMLTHDQYIRLGEQTNSIPELVDLIFQSLEAFAWMMKKYSTEQYTKSIRQVIQYIQSNLAKKITLGELAKLTELSPSYLSRLIKKETGLSLVGLIDSYRIEEGKYLLLNTDYSILQIAEMTGFNYQYHFALRFKKYAGMTPSHFRRTGGIDAK